MTLILIVALPDTLASSVTGPMDVFGASNSLWQRQAGVDAGVLFESRVVSAQGESVTASNGLSLQAAGSLAGEARPDVVLVPAVHFHSVRRLQERARHYAPTLAPLAGWLRAGTVVAGCCTGTFFLAEAGLLDGRRATTPWWLKAAFHSRYPRVRLQGDAIVVEDGGVYTGGAVTAYLSLAVALVRRFAGDEMANLCARTLLVDVSRTSQAPYAQVDAEAEIVDTLVLKAQDWMQVRLNRGVDLEHLAVDLAVSTRTLNRHFKRATGESPREYLQKLRVEQAKQLLERTALPLDAVAERVGYADTSTLRRVFRQRTDLSPSEYRRRFRGARRGE